MIIVYQKSTDNTTYVDIFITNKKIILKNINYIFLKCNRRSKNISKGIYLQYALLMRLEYKSTVRRRKVWILSPL